MAFDQVNGVAASIGAKGLPEEPPKGERLLSETPVMMSRTPHLRRLRKQGVNDGSKENSTDLQDENRTDLQGENSTALEDDAVEETEQVAAWKRDTRVLLVLVFYYTKAYVAIFLTLTSVFFLLSHDCTQYVGQLRVGPTSKEAHQAAGCPCGPRCGRVCEKHIQHWKVCIGGFHAWWNTAVGVLTFMIIHCVCPGGDNCLGAESIAAVAVATGLLKTVENRIQSARRGLNKFDSDVRHSAKLVDTHPKHVNKLSMESAHAAHEMVSFLSEDHAKYASLGVLLASAENGYSAAFYSMGYCHKCILTPFVAKLHHSMEVELEHFEEIAKEAFAEAAQLFKFVRDSCAALESAMHSLAKRHADPSDHDSILATIQKDLSKLDEMVGELAGTIAKYAPRVLDAPNEAITALMDELEQLEVAGLHLFDRVFPEDRALASPPMCCSGTKYMKVNQMLECSLKSEKDTCT